MRHTVVVVAILCTLACAARVQAQVKKCPPDAVAVGTVCVDKYEASVWQIALSNKSLVKKLQKGKATLDDLKKVGATQLGCAADPVFPGPFNLTAYPASFPASGQWTPIPGSDPPSPGVYAVSIPGVLPSTCITWFQAAQACRLAGKRLLTNLEWQDAAAGTPDFLDNGTTDCNVSAAGTPVDTGSRSSCRSSWGAFDMVGNVYEWVADWANQNNSPCTDSGTVFGFNATNDVVCFGGNGSAKIPGALIRGGFWNDADAAGVFAVSAGVSPAGPNDMVGFRCAR